MILVKCIYLMLIIGLLIFSVLYIDSLAVVLLLCALILPVILKFCLLWLKCSSHASLNCSTAVCTVNHSVPVSVVIDNRCPLFFPKAYATVSVCHAFSTAPERIQLRFPLHGRNSTKLTFSIRPDCCGAVRIKIEKIRVPDCLRLSSIRMKKNNSELELLVLPELLHLAMQNTAEAVYAPESHRYADKPGDDSSEIFGIREYHSGDAVSRIHWKLSSKSEDKLFIKEFGYPIEKQVLLLAEYLPDTESDALVQMHRAQAFLTLIYSLAVYLTKSEDKAFLAWHDGTHLIYRSLQSEQELPDIFKELYRTLDRMTLEAQDLRDIFSGQQYSSVTLVTNDVNAEMLPVLEQQAEAKRKNLAVMTSETLVFQSDTVSVRRILPDALAEGVSGMVI
ncbi:MAG: DUF58 domain-containing protein [Oscillospiraceae bacterium]|nr:DUF58 domain-containing protein [Oscillospiraceae bacterium]